jgi:hypothetical protein
MEKEASVSSVRDVSLRLDAIKNRAGAWDSLLNVGTFLVAGLRLPSGETITSAAFMSIVGAEGGSPAPRVEIVWINLGAAPRASVEMSNTMIVFESWFKRYRYSDGPTGGQNAKCLTGKVRFAPG